MSSNRLKKYTTLIFDCDGVILNSNHIKSEAFFKVAELYGKESAIKLKNYHLERGGVSRFEKFKYFFDEIIKSKYTKEDMETILFNFSYEVKSLLKICDLSPYLERLKLENDHLDWMVISGGLQSELIEIFEHRKINNYFNKGIYGSPKNKLEIFNDVMQKGLSIDDCLFLGDSKYDFEVSRKVGCDFLFVSDWTDIVDWEEWCKNMRIKYISNLYDLLE